MRAYKVSSDTKESYFTDNYRRWREAAALPDFRERLRRFNTDIKSLSLCDPDYEICEYPPNDSIDIYISKTRRNKYKSEGNNIGKQFTAKEDKIFLEERKREVDRLLHLLSLADSYTDKLTILFENRGHYLKFTRLQIIDNEHNILADLTPSNKGETTAYNMLLMQYIINPKDESRYISPCSYFDLEKEILLFNTRVNNSTHPEVATKNEIQKVEQDYSFDQSKEVNNTTAALWSQDNLFNFLNFGNTIDYSISPLSYDDCLNILNTEAVVNYYRHLHNKPGISKTLPSYAHSYEPTNILYSSFTEAGESIKGSLIPALKEMYTGKPPMPLVLMLFGLESLGFISDTFFSRYQYTDIADMLKDEFSMNAAGRIAESVRKQIAACRKPTIGRRKDMKNEIEKLEKRLGIKAPMHK